MDFAAAVISDSIMAVSSAFSIHVHVISCLSLFQVSSQSYGFFASHRGFALTGDWRAKWQRAFIFRVL